MVEYKAIVPPYYSTRAITFLLPRYSSLFFFVFVLSLFGFAICPFLLFLSLIFFFLSYPPLMSFDLL
jgi:uncharacterized membrane protein